MVDDDFTLNCTNRDGVCVVACIGELDLAGAPLVRCLLQAHLLSGPVVVDASAITFLDCAGLSAFLSARRAADEHDRAFVLAAPSVAVLRVLDVTRTMDVLAPFPSVSSAIRACRVLVGSP